MGCLPITNRQKNLTKVGNLNSTENNNNKIDNNSDNNIDNSGNLVMGDTVIVNEASSATLNPTNVATGDSISQTNITGNNNGGQSATSSRSNSPVFIDQNDNSSRNENNNNNNNNSSITLTLSTSPKSSTLNLNNNQNNNNNNNPHLSDQITEISLIVEGELTKQGHIFKTWRERWFKLENGYMMYYKSKDDTEPIDKVPLRGARISKKPFHSKPNIFELLVPSSLKKVFLLQAKSPKEMDYWIVEIQKASQLARTTSTLEK